MKTEDKDREQNMYKDVSSILQHSFFGVSFKFSAISYPWENTFLKF